MIVCSLDYKVALRYAGKVFVICKQKRPLQDSASLRTFLFFPTYRVKNLWVKS